MTKNDAILFNSHLTLSGHDNARALTIIQSDDTVLEFTLRDKNLEPIILAEQVGQAQIIDSKRNALVATFDVQIDGSKATFSIDKILPVTDYELYIKIGNQYFPSKEQSFLLRVIKAYDVVEDIDLNSRTTIDIVVDALRDDVISVIKEQLEIQIDAAIKADPSRFKGEKGDKFTRDDFTQEDWLSLKGEDAVPLKPSQLNGSELELIRGHSAYQVAVNEGFVGTEEEWLATLKGEKGDKPTRKDFTEEEWASLKGEDGKSLTFEQLSPEQQEALRGYSAYQIAVNKGFEGNVEQWLESLKGEKGDKFTRDDFTGEEWLSLKGEKGDKGDTGDSAYEEALKNGFVGSEVEWLESLKGKNGLHGNTTSIENNEDGSYDIVVANPTTEVEVARITIRDGADGINGSDGKNLRYEDLTPEQITELQEGLPVRPPKIYTRAEYDTLESYDEHTLYFVVEE